MNDFCSATTHITPRVIGFSDPIPSPPPLPTPLRRPPSTFEVLMPPPLPAPPDPTGSRRVSAPSNASKTTQISTASGGEMAIDDAPSGLERLLESIAATKNPDGSVTIPSQTFAALVNMVQEVQRESRRVEARLKDHEAQLGRLDELDAQKTRLDELHRKINALAARPRPTHPLPANPSSWAMVTANGSPAQPGSQPSSSVVQRPTTLPPRSRKSTSSNPAGSSSAA